MASALAAKAPVGCFTQCTRSRNGGRKSPVFARSSRRGALTAVGAAHKLPLDAEPEPQRARPRGCEARRSEAVTCPLGGGRGGEHPRRFGAASLAVCGRAEAHPP